jgi:hypothetical protein
MRSGQLFELPRGGVLPSVNQPHNGDAMNTRIKILLEKLEKLEDELREELRQQSQQFQYQLEGTRVRFDQAITEAHRRVKTGLLAWFRASSLQNVLSVPFIYGMVIPLALLDLAATVFQAACFRLYRIPRVRRSKYILLDRHYLSYLNSIEKFNCLYCGYANGVIAYVREIASRTEQYWCPIKHARYLPGAHRRYRRFLEYGDAENLEKRLEEFRDELVGHDEGQ